MVEFTAAPGDVEMGLEPRRLVLVEKRSSSGRMWTIIGALILLVACFGGAVLFVWHLNGKAEATVGRNEGLLLNSAPAAQWTAAPVGSDPDLCLFSPPPAASAGSDRGAGEQDFLGRLLGERRSVGQSPSWILWLSLISLTNFSLLLHRS